MLESGKTARIARSNLTSGLVLTVAAALAVLVGIQFLPQLRGADFPDFYCAARILLDGQAQQLYNPALQYQYQAAYASRVGTLYIHPPFEVVIFLSVAWLPLQYAYVLWSLLNVVFLAAAMRLLANGFPPLWKWQIVFAASLTFVPVLLCLQQGQDSLLLLLLITLAFTNLRRENNFSAGCWLALGLFKFQIVLPLALIVLCGELRERRWKFAEGFGLVGCALLAVSAAICGKSVFTAYPAFLIHLPAEHFAGVAPRAMPNLRGIVELLIGWREPSHAGIVIAILSAALFLWAVFTSPARSGHSRDFEISFAATTLCALLVSYHLNPHDLSLLLLPILLLLSKARKAGSPPLSRNTMLVLVLVAWLPPPHAWLLRSDRYAMMGFLLVGLFLMSGGFADRSDVDNR